MAGKPRGKPGREIPLSGLSNQAKDYVESIGQVGQRARRRDATGRARRDYHKDTATLAVRVPVNLADQVKRQAKADGMSVNAWLLALIERELAS